MKVFVSWSGELSKSIAEILKRNIPCIIQSVEIFFSPNDIIKGEGWSSRINKELNECNFGIVCLTEDNITAPWLHFEAGALSKAFDSKVAALMVNINPSDIQGPLKQFQCTNLEKKDFLLLVESINKVSDMPLDKVVLEGTFDPIWERMKNEIDATIKSKQSTKSKPAKQQESDKAIEEILALLRKQNNLISNPELLFPKEYIESFISQSYRNRNLYVNHKNLNYIDINDMKKLVNDLLRWGERLYNVAKDENKCEIEKLFSIIMNFLEETKKSKILDNEYLANIVMRIAQIQSGMIF